MSEYSTADAAERDDYTAALVPLTGRDAVSTRDQARAARSALTRASVNLERQQQAARAELDRQRAELEEQFARQRAELEALAAPLREQLTKLTEVLWSVDLYLGREETLRLLREGTPADRQTPIVVRQRVLVMAEESLVLMGQKATGMTSDDVPEFVDWLLADDANLNRVLPERKGAVVLVPTKLASQTGNMFEDAARNEANRRSYWLIRNGERLYLLTVDPQLEIGDRLLPRRDEFTSVFDRRLFGYGRRDGEALAPGSEEWLAMEREADTKRRHFMRVLLVLQGLIDRTPALHPLPEGGASFLRLSDQDDGRVVLLNDADDAYTIGTGRETFAEYQRRLNRLLRPGMRIVANFRAEPFRDLRYRSGGHPRLSPEKVDCVPESNVPHLIEARRDGGLLIRFKRTDTVERRNVPVPDQPGYVYPVAFVEPSRRASCVIRPEDSWALPFDLVRVDELEAFLASRDERSASFLSMVPTIRAALQAKRDEAAAEAPFRELLRGRLTAAGAAEGGADALVDELVHWWKVANTWARPLNGDREHEGRAAAAILAEFEHRRAAADDERTDMMVRLGRTVPGVVAVARDRQGTWKSFSASADLPGSEALEPRVLVDVTTLRTDGTLGKVERSLVLAQRTVSALMVAWSADEWQRWTFGVQRRNYLDAAERALVLAEARERCPALPLAVTERFDPERPAEGRRLAVYFWRDGDPATTEPRPSHNPLQSTNGWGEFRDDAVVGIVEFEVVRIDGSPTLRGPVRRPLSPRSFTHYSVGADASRWGSVPWWPRAAKQVGDVRSRLVWADEAALDRMKQWECRSVALARSKDDAARALDREASLWGAALHEAIRARMEAEARERFDEDYPDADDLWPAHLQSLALQPPVHVSHLTGLVRVWLQAGRNPDGRTVAELHGFLKERTRDGRWTEEVAERFGDVVAALQAPTASSAG